jgi:hypothetical protein
LPSNSPALQTNIRIVCDMMLKTHYYEEENWLRTAARSAGFCGAAGAQSALRRAARIAREFGFPDVAAWVEADVLEAAPRRARGG